MGKTHTKTSRKQKKAKIKIDMSGVVTFRV